MERTGVDLNGLRAAFSEDLDFRVRSIRAVSRPIIRMEY
jgi:hypothetical protein